MKTPIYKILTFITVVGLMAACTPLPTAPASNNLTLEMRQLNALLSNQEKSMQSLSYQVAELERKLQRQAEEIEQLSKVAQQGQNVRQATRTTQSQGLGTTVIPGEGSPTEVYLQAFGDYASGRYQAAVYGFETFLQRFPNNSYASNAQFWLADCYFSQQQYPLAIKAFERLINDFPSAPKIPDALLKIAIAQLQLGATGEARQAVDSLSRRYPKSAAAQKAQELTIP